MSYIVAKSVTGESDSKLCKISGRGKRSESIISGYEQANEDVIVLCTEVPKGTNLGLR